MKDQKTTQVTIEVPTVSTLNKILKYVAVAILSIVVLYGAVWIITPKPTMPAELKAQIDSLIAINKQLELEQLKLDSAIARYEDAVIRLDDKISKVKNQTTIIKEIHHDKIKEVSNLNSAQVDSFFKTRYNY